MTNVKRSVVPVEMVLGLLLGSVLGFWNIFSCTEARINPSISCFQYILKSFLGRVPLACAMLQVRYLRYKTIILFAPKDIYMVMRDVHCLPHRK
tara:strand:+ start:1410 stop:1691 length:282 start_codon:yes stop_codon:yes gene_type:complete